MGSTSSQVNERLVISTKIGVWEGQIKKTQEVIKNFEEAHVHALRSTPVSKVPVMDRRLADIKKACRDYIGDCQGVLGELRKELRQIR